MSKCKRELVCIVCPKGCRLTVEIDENNQNGYKVSGNSCDRGAEYGVREVTNPTRVITSTVKIKNGSLRRLPVRTNGAIPKDKIFECMRVINLLEIEVPVNCGDILVENILDTGIDLIASRSM